MLAKMVAVVLEKDGVAELHDHISNRA